MNDTQDFGLPTCFGDNDQEIKEQLIRAKECEVENLKIELCNIQREKTQLMQQRKLLKCAGPQDPCQNTPMNFYVSSGNNVSSCEPCEQKQTAPPIDTNDVCMQLKDLREQYNQLQDDYKKKIVEVSCLRNNEENLKCRIKELEIDKQALELRMTNMEKKIQILEAEKGNKEKYIEQEQALNVLKHRFHELQGELEEVRSNLQAQTIQAEEYRKKFLLAQQIVEEQKRQLQLMEMDNARINEKVTKEIGRIKNQFQEKLSELAPLPEILKETQLKLQDCQQNALITERNYSELNQENITLKNKVLNCENQVKLLCKENMELQSNMSKISELEEKLLEMKVENERLRESNLKVEENYEQLKQKMDEKLHEITQLTAMIDQLREDSARQVIRNKERSEMTRKTLQNQICEIEKELIQCKATIRAAYKDRDEIRNKIEQQVNVLSNLFTQAQGRMNLLKGHVNYLKDKPTENCPPPPYAEDLTHNDPVVVNTKGYDTCCCNVYR